MFSGADSVRCDGGNHTVLIERAGSARSDRVLRTYNKIYYYVITRENKNINPFGR